MKVYFETFQLQEIYETPLEEMKGKQKIPKEVIKQYKKRIQLLLVIERLEQLRPYKGLNFEFLRGDKKGKCSMRLNKQYRLLITPINEMTIQVILVNEISKHYE